MKKLLCVSLFTLSSSLFTYLTAQNVWEEKASLTADGGRSAAVGFGIGHYGYLGLGGTPAGDAIDFWRWNQDSNTWTAIATYPGVGRNAATAFTIGGSGYVCLGYSGSAYGTDLWEYDTANNTWTQKAGFPGVGRSNAFAFVIGTTAYVGGGEPGGRPYYQDVWAYDATANTWTQVANFGGGVRAGCTAFTLNGYGYVGCGTDGTNLHNDLWQYNPNTNTWASMASLPVTGSEIDIPITFVLDTLAYVGTGSGASGYIRDFWSYSATTNSWADIATLPGVARWAGTGFTVGNAGYGGFGVDSVGDYLPDFWQYGPAATGISEIKNNKANVSVFPNPANGMFTFSYTNVNEENVQLMLTDVLGKTISVYKMNGVNGKLSIDGSLLSNGVYFYKVNSGNLLLASGKFVIQK